MASKPKVKPTLMWGIIQANGVPWLIQEERPGNFLARKNKGETIQRVLVCAPKGRKRK